MKMLLAGEWVDREQKIEVRDPYDDSFIDSVPAASAEDVETALATAAEGNDLVVLGARGHGAVGAALLGSVSSWMLHHVHRPIVVVPDGVAADGG